MPALVLVVPVEGKAYAYIDASKDDDQRIALDLAQRDLLGDLIDALWGLVGPCEGAS